MIHRGLPPPARQDIGQGRRTNRIAVVLAATSRWKSLPPRVRLWNASEGLDPWTRLLMEGCLAGAGVTGFEFLWHYWLKEERPGGGGSRAAPGRRTRWCWWSLRRSTCLSSRTWPSRGSRR